MLKHLKKQKHFGKHTLINQIKMKKIITLLFIIPFLGFSQEYVYTKDSEVQKDVPQGIITKHTFESDVFKNTTRDYYIYVPAQYDASKPAALMVFQDGHSYVNKKGEYRIPVVFDNLIHQGKMPVTIGLFINPGHEKSKEAIESPWRSSNRSVEYDSMNGDYGRFLIEEMIPELKKNLNISDDPKMRAIGGLSSGGICAFSAAWFYPEAFHKVLSHFGSFADIRGGHNYPPMIRKADRKDIKVFLQDGKNDLDNQFGNWWLANLQMEKALKFKDYDYLFVSGNGGHDGRQGGTILPETLEWLWSDVVKKEKVASGVYKFENDTLLMNGETTHFQNMEFSTIKLSQNDTLINRNYDIKEQIFIVKEGKIEVSIDDETKTIGANSVAFVLPKDRITIVSKSPNAAMYHMVYSGKEKSDLKRGKENAGSFIIDFDELEFNEHGRGGIRNYFHTKTATVGYYEMHVTNLNAGIKSHEPHTHHATEIVLMIDGNTQMEIGDEIYKGNAGDIYFLASDIPHAIENIGNKQCMYFAFQWD